MGFWREACGTSQSVVAGGGERLPFGALRARRRQLKGRLASARAPVGLSGASRRMARQDDFAPLAAPPSRRHCQDEGARRQDGVRPLRCGIAKACCDDGATGPGSDRVAEVEESDVVHCTGGCFVSARGRRGRRRFHPGHGVTVFPGAGAPSGAIFIAEPCRCEGANHGRSAIRRRENRAASFARASGDRFRDAVHAVAMTVLRPRPPDLAGLCYPRLAMSTRTRQPSPLKSTMSSPSTAIRSAGPREMPLQSKLPETT